MSKDNFKVFVTKDFPKIYEERVHFENDDPNNDTAILEDAWYDNEPYCERWISAVIFPLNLRRKNS